eukprot:TRINITY_DN20753_c0_g1_i1.p1 TRINITY_DN20753_c0_g1~~TRINITY_DN20753_c0_g1_i1.p1  ORF type:complete len:222 (+),score=29.12 TRINITY_DN20753_c0_g1_i1:378-1043(+)
MTDGMVTGLSFLTHRSSHHHSQPVHGLLAYIDTHRGLMWWDSRVPDQPPTAMPAELNTHHSSHVATAPVEGGIFYTIPCEQKHVGHIPDADHILHHALESKCGGRLLHLDPHSNQTTQLADGLLYPTSVAVPFSESFALVLEPLAYRVTRVSLSPKDLGTKSGFLTNLPVFPCAIAPEDQFSVTTGFWVALCGPRRNWMLGFLHSHPVSYTHLTLPTKRIV